MGALAGVRVLDFGQWIAGPLTAQLLADQGAEVIHIDPPGGPRWRSPANATLNRGKRTLALDLKDAAARATARRLAAEADVLIENFRPGVLARLGLDPAALCAAHPRLIACSLPGFAADHPHADLPAWEGVIAAATGCYPPIADSPVERPRFTALTLPSVFGALAAVNAIVLALVARERDGAGQQIIVPLFDAMVLAIGSAGLLVNGQPAGDRPDDPWTGVFACRDGAHVRIALATPRFLRRFVEGAGRQDWIERGWLVPGALPRGSAQRAQQEEELRDTLRSRTADAWEALGRAVDAPVTRIRTGAEWLQTEHARTAAIVTAVADPEYGVMTQPGLAVVLDGTPGAVQPRAAQPGAPDWSPRAAPTAMPAANDEEPGRPALDHRRALSSVGASAATGSEPARPALDGLRVLDITQVLAGPTATRTLAEFGASVVKLNNPWEEGSGYRWNVHRYHTDVNRGKATALVDLKTPAGLEIFWRLVDQADVVMQNFRPGVPERLGIDYEQIRARRPDIIHGTVSLYGGPGPWAALPGYEINAQAVSGMTARADHGPLPFAVNDYTTGLLGAYALALALYHRARTGEGQSVHASLARAATLLQLPYLQEYDGKVWDEPTGAAATGWGPLQRLYRASDGWFFLGARADQRPALAAVPGLAGIEALADDALAAVLAERVATGARADWLAALTAAGAGAHAVVSAGAAMADPWMAAHGLSVTRVHPGEERITTIGPPMRLSRTPVQPGRPVAPPGYDAAEVLAQIGLAAQHDALVAQQVVVLE